MASFTPGFDMLTHPKRMEAASLALQKAAKNRNVKRNLADEALLAAEEADAAYDRALVLHNIIASE
jgi:hypothetical protein